jgi:glycine cleavage system aminomethyltransferase T
MVLPWLLAGFAVADPETVLLGRETIYRDGRRVGWPASGGWCHRLNLRLGYGYVRDPEAGAADPSSYVQSRSAALRFSRRAQRAALT